MEESERYKALFRHERILWLNIEELGQETASQAVCTVILVTPCPHPPDLSHLYCLFVREQMNTCMPWLFSMTNGPGDSAVETQHHALILSACAVCINRCFAGSNLKLPVFVVSPWCFIERKLVG